MPAKREWRPYLEARDYIRALGLKSQRKWLKYCKKDRLCNIPSNPQMVYKNKGWIDWNDWLGTNNKDGAPRIYRVNDDYFKKWSSNMSYILGFWFADGCMGRVVKTKIFTITQNKKDKYLLEAMLKEIDSDHVLTFTKKDNCCRFTICSETIYNDIIKLGGKERKSFDIKFPYVPEKYIPDFIRGLWDGDGSVFYSEQKKAYISSYSSASVELINKLYSTLKDNIPNLGGTLAESDGEYSLQFAKKDSFKLGKFI